MASSSAATTGLEVPTRGGEPRLQSSPAGGEAPDSSRPDAAGGTPTRARDPLTTARTPRHCNKNKTPGSKAGGGGTSAGGGGTSPKKPLRVSTGASSAVSDATDATLPSREVGPGARAGGPPLSARARARAMAHPGYHHPLPPPGSFHRGGDPYYPHPPPHPHADPYYDPYYGHPDPYYGHRGPPDHSRGGGPPPPGYYHEPPHHHPASARHHHHHPYYPPPYGYDHPDPYGRRGEASEEERLAAEEEGRLAAPAGEDGAAASRERSDSKELRAVSSSFSAGSSRNDGGEREGGGGGKGYKHSPGVVTVGGSVSGKPGESNFFAGPSQKGGYLLVSFVLFPLFGLTLNSYALADELASESRTEGRRRHTVPADPLGVEGRRRRGLRARREGRLRRGSRGDPRQAAE